MFNFKYQVRWVDAAHLPSAKITDSAIQELVIEAASIPELVLNLAEVVGSAGQIISIRLLTETRIVKASIDLGKLSEFSANLLKHINLELAEGEQITNIRLINLRYSPSVHVPFGPNGFTLPPNYFQPNGDKVLYIADLLTYREYSVTPSSNQSYVNIDCMTGNMCWYGMDLTFTAPGGEVFKLCDAVADLEIEFNSQMAIQVADYRSHCDGDVISPEAVKKFMVDSGQVKVKSDQ